MLIQCICAFLSTVGYCFIFNIPRRHLIPASFVGAAGWALYQYLTAQGESKIAACFAAACLVTALAELFSRICKDAAILFSIPGILPIVPGAGMYNTMRAFLARDLEQTAAVGYETILMAASIAVGLLVVSSLLRIVPAVASLVPTRTE